MKEAYCSPEITKLLEEKGFPKGDFTHYEYDPKVITAYKTCTHQKAMAWLRGVHHIEINITFGFPFIDGKPQYKYFWSVIRVCDNHLEYPMNDSNSAFYNEEMADSYEEAVEAASKYSLENLI